MIFLLKNFYIEHLNYYHGVLNYIIFLYKKTVPKMG